MAYYRFTRLQQYINGQPTDTYTKGERVDDVDYSTYETCMGGSGNSRWVSIPQTVCYNGDLWSMEKEQISYDGGQTWVDTGNTRRAAVIEPSASQCSGADNDWRVVYGEYICNGTTKCLKEAEYANNVPTGRTRAGSIVELLSEDCGVMYQWVNVPGEYVCVFKCGRGDKYTKQKQQYSLDNGVHWEDTGETREGDFVEKNSSYCGCDTSVTRWVTVSGEYVCVGTSKYTKEKEQTSTDVTNWTDTGNTRAGSLIEASSSSCASTRWVTVSGQYSCVGTDKYNLEKEQTSTDGTNWTDTGNTRAGSTLIEANSTDCGYVPTPITRWVTVSGEYVCVRFDKYNKEKEQISYDSGSTWTDTGNTKAGSTLIEGSSSDCGFYLSGNLPCYIAYFDNYQDAYNFATSNSYVEGDCSTSFASWKKWVCDSKSSYNEWYDDDHYYYGHYYENYLFIENPDVQSMAKFLFPESEDFYWEDMDDPATPYIVTYGEYKRGTINSGYMDEYFINARLNDDSIKDNRYNWYSSHPNSSGRRIEWTIYHYVKPDKYAVTKIIENVEYNSQQFVLKTCPNHNDIVINLERIAHRRGRYATSDTDGFVEYQ